MPRRTKLPTSLADLTLGKIVAYILVAYAIAMLVRAVWLSLRDEPFDIASSSPVPLCQHATSLPCHYRQMRGEDVSCDYAWNAPAVFRKDIRLNGSNADDAMKKLQFCTINSNDTENITASSCDNTLSSVWTNYTTGLDDSNSELTSLVGQLGKNVIDNNKNVVASQKAMRQARMAMNKTSRHTSNSNRTLSSINNRLGQQHTCNKTLVQTQDTLAKTRTQLETTKDSLTNAKTELETTKETLTSAQTELETTKATLTSTQAELATAQTQLIDSQGNSQFLSTNNNTTPPSTTSSTSTTDQVPLTTDGTVSQAPPSSVSTNLT